jgi:hypothetical protein
LRQLRRIAPIGAIRLLSAQNEISIRTANMRAFGTSGLGLGHGGL